MRSDPIAKYTHSFPALWLYVLENTKKLLVRSLTIEVYLPVIKILLILTNKNIERESNYKYTCCRRRAGVLRPRLKHPELHFSILNFDSFFQYLIPSSTILVSQCWLIIYCIDFQLIAFQLIVRKHTLSNFKQIT